MTLNPRWRKLEGWSFNQLLNTLLSLKQEIDCKTILQKKGVPWSIFIIEGVILLNSSTNLILNCFSKKFTTKQTCNLLRLFRPNTPKKVFLIKQLEQKTKKKQLSKVILCWCNFILNFRPILGVFCPENPKTTILPKHVLLKFSNFMLLQHHVKIRKIQCIN